MFAKAGDSETTEGLTVGEVTRQSLGGALLWLPRSYREGVSQGGAAVTSPRSQRKRWSWRQDQGVSPG